ncbi:class I SAM-dependent methyltransferase [candidate division KSB1 bacterium]|nr:class I SAM-dependent methyltransferase [candidate division KSB1 bacterium]
MSNHIVKRQFNRQAEKFANWSVGENIEFMNAYFEFCEIQPHDRLLDVACGPGEFTIFIAKMISVARGVDISDREIEIANGFIKEFGLDNIGFDCTDVEVLAYDNNSYSIVVCKSAFHHFRQTEVIFNEMRLSVDLRIDEYLEHAVQNRENHAEALRLLAKGQKDKKLDGYLFKKNDMLFFKRPVYIILGRK